MLTGPHAVAPARRRRLTIPSYITYHLHAANAVASATRTLNASVPAALEIRCHMPFGMCSAAPASSTSEPSGRSVSRLRLRSPAPMPHGARSCHKWTVLRPETTMRTESVSSRCVPESVTPTLQKTCVDGVWIDGDRSREDAGTDLHVPVRGVGQAPAVRAADSSSWHRCQPRADLCGNQVSRAPRHRRDVPG